MTNELLFAIIGIGGTLLAAVITQVTQFIREGRQRGWTEADLESSWRRERVARLFDHKRFAYTEFMTEYQSFYNATFQYVHNLLSEPHPPPDYDTFDPLYDKLIPVEIYGSEAVSQSANSLFKALTSWADSDDATRKERSRQLQEAWSDFQAAVRADLGVDD